MARFRFKALARLLLLLGLPVAFVGALFGAGVYVGVANRPAVLAFERDWLGMEVEVPTDPWLRERVQAVRALKVPTPDPSEVKPSAVKPSEVKPPPEVKPQPEGKPPETEAPARPRLPLVIALPQPLEGELVARLRAPLRLTVKVYVEPAAAPDPLAYALRTVEWASQVLDAEVGVTLEVVGVGLWRPSRAALEDVCGRPAEDAEVVIGLTAGPPGDPAGAVGESGRCLIAGRSPRSLQAPHLRTLLVGLGQRLGAAPIVDPASEAWREGSWMADPLADDSQPLTLDGASRRAILERKGAAPAGGAG